MSEEMRRGSLRPVYTKFESEQTTSCLKQATHVRAYSARGSTQLLFPEQSLYELQSELYVCETKSRQHTGERARAKLVRRFPHTCKLRPSETRVSGYPDDLQPRKTRVWY